MYAPYERQPFMMCIPQQLNPRARGTVSLRSADPYDPPVIDPNYLSDPRDVDDLVAGKNNLHVEWEITTPGYMKIEPETGVKR